MIVRIAIDGEVCNLPTAFHPAGFTKPNRSKLLVVALVSCGPAAAAVTSLSL